jgi:peroxiredoxin
MAQLRRDYQQFVDRNTEIIAIGPEDTQPFADWWHEHQMPFVGVADPQHIIAKMYGQQVKLLKLGRMPASLLLDKTGYIRYKHFGESMSDIPENQEVLLLIDEINREDGSIS